MDDELRQKGPTSDMIFKVPFLISYISAIMTLMEGDVILTGSDTFFSACFSHQKSYSVLFICSSAGTPEGVGPVRVGQKIKAGITDLIDVEFDVQRRNQSFSG